MKFVQFLKWLVPTLIFLLFLYCASLTLPIGVAAYELIMEGRMKPAVFLWVCGVQFAAAYATYKYADYVVPQSAQQWLGSLYLKVQSKFINRNKEKSV